MEPQLQRQPEPIRPEPTSQPLPFKEPEGAGEDAKLDEVMLAMDVVDTLRHEQMLITRDINSEDRRESLVERLRGIYRGQGIEVPDHILLDGVRALEEERFRYQPPPDGWKTRLARLYINRGRWLPGAGLVAALLVALPAVNYFGFQRPAELREVRAEQALAALPAQLDSLERAALATDPVPEAQRRVDTLVAQAEAEIAQGDAAAAGALVEELQDLTATLALEYDISFINNDGVMDGVQLGNSTFAIVGALAPDGARIRIPVTSTVTGNTRTVGLFGIEVGPQTFSRIEADFLDNGRIDAAQVGSKARGELAPEFTLDDVRAGRINTEADFPRVQ